MIKAIVGTALLAALTGCTLKMGNTSLGLFEGWNQPTATVQKSETMVTPTVTTTVTPAPVK